MRYGGHLRLVVAGGASLVALLPNVYAEGQQSQSVPAFEVASVKPNRSGDQRWGFATPGNRFEATNAPLQNLIAFAYGEPGPPPENRADYLILGGPSWKNTERFDVNATTGRSVPSDLGERNAQKMEMLRSLLVERFKLAVHHDMREGPIYAIVLANRDARLGPQLHHSDIDCTALIAAAAGRESKPTPSPPPPGPSDVLSPLTCGLQVRADMLRVGGQPMAAIARLLSRVMDRPVVDRTGLAGAFDLSLTFDSGALPNFPAPPPADTSRATSDNPSIFTAMEEQGGLKLQTGRGPIDVLVIDHLEHPTEN